MSNTQALDLFVGGVDVLPALASDGLREVLREIALMVEMDGLLDDLTPDDARHTAAGAFADLVLKGGDPAECLRHRAEWVLTADGGEPLDSPVMVSDALLRWARIIDS